LINLLEEGLIDKKELFEKMRRVCTRQARDN